MERHSVTGLVDDELPFYFDDYETEKIIVL